MITSEDCKNFIVDLYNNKQISTDIKEWKRINKYKEDGIWIRNFSHDIIGIVTICEENGELFVKAHPDVISFSEPDLNQIQSIIREDNTILLKSFIKSGLNVDTQLTDELPLIIHSIKYHAIDCFNLLLENNAEVNCSYLPSYHSPIHYILNMKLNFDNYLLPLLNQEQFNITSDSNDEPPLSVLFFNLDPKCYSQENFNTLVNHFINKGFEKELLSTFETNHHPFSCQYRISNYQQKGINNEHPLLKYLIINEYFDTAKEYINTLKVNPTDIFINNQNIKAYFTPLTNDLINQNYSEESKSRFYKLQQFLNEIQQMQPKKVSNSPLLKKKKF